MFDVFYMGDNPELVDRLGSVCQTSNVLVIEPGVKDIESQTKMYWLIEPNVEITDSNDL